MNSTPFPFLSAFNAKAMSFEEVARLFVVSDKFQHLAGQWNSLLVGPRGSGKTTLLKMLSLPGLRAWEGEEADRYRSTLRYTGIYVPSDIAWGEMVRALGNGELNGQCFDLISEAAFTTNVFLSTINTVQQRLEEDGGSFRTTYRGLSFDTERIEQFVEFAAEVWKLSPRALTMRSLQASLSNRLLDIRQQALRVANHQHPDIDLVFNLLPYAGIAALTATSEVLTAFDNLAEERDGLWALLLDEFEVAPLSLQRLVLAGLRASSPKLLIKVALAPCGPHTLLDLKSSAPPTATDDYKQVELWYAEKGEADDFCRKVFSARVKDDPILNSMAPEQVFGRSQYAIVDEAGEIGGLHPALGRGETWAAEFVSLVIKDPSFEDFLIRKKIDPQNLNPSPDAPNGNTIRKIAPVVAFRNAYRGISEGKKRGRKPYTSVYSGWQALAAISEGNPRWLLAMLTGIFAEIDTNSGFPVNVTQQQRQAAATAGTFAEMLRTVASQQNEGISTQVPVFFLLEKIGRYFHDRIVRDSFQEDPPLSFVVDDDVPDDYEACLRIALNHGAIVCYEQSDTVGGFKTLRNKRFRLAYLLSPVFKLPVRTSKQVRLSSILKDEHPLEGNSAGTVITQGILF